MTSLHQIYDDIFSKSRFLAQDNHFSGNKVCNESPWQKLNRVDEIIQKLPESVHHYIAYLCSLYKRTPGKTLTIEMERAIDNLNPTLKKVCEIYAIGLLVCDDLLTRINFLNTTRKSTRITIPTISYNNVCSYLAWIGNILLKALNKTTKNSDDTLSLSLTQEEIATLNCYSKLLITVYNSSALGIFRKQPVRRFNAEHIAMHA